jgi:hypothetical protein
MSDAELIRLACPKCQHPIRVKPDLAGKQVRCPQPLCRTLFRVPPPVKSVQATPRAVPVIEIEDEPEEADRPRRRRFRRRSHDGLSSIEFLCFGAAFLVIPLVNVVASSILYYVWRGSRPRRATQINLLGFGVFAVHLLIYLVTLGSSADDRGRTNFSEDNGRADGPRETQRAEWNPPPFKRTPARQANPPTVPDHCLFRPTFNTQSGEITAGTAFPVQMPGHARPIIITAIHLLGPSGGMPFDVPPPLIGRMIKGVVLEDLFDERHEVDIGSDPLIIAEAGPSGRPSKAGDIVAFWASKDGALQPLTLARALPEEGERVWLAASLVGGAPASQRLHAATVAAVDDKGEYIYAFDNPQLELRATSGAPVLNSAGEVVAINLGGGQNGNKIFGFGNPVTRFRPFLEAAAKAGGPKSQQ